MKVQTEHRVEATITCPERVHIGLHENRRVTIKAYSSISLDEATSRIRDLARLIDEEVDE